MKKVMLMLTTVIMCSISAWSQSIVSICNDALEKKTISGARVVFESRGLWFDDLFSTPTHIAGMDLSAESKADAILWSIDAYNNQQIKEISFVCGINYWQGIESTLVSFGYKLTKEGTTKLGNGSVVPQKTYSRGNKICLINTIGSQKQIIFKYQTSANK